MSRAYCDGSSMGRRSGSIIAWGYLFLVRQRFAFRSGSSVAAVHGTLSNGLLEWGFLTSWRLRYLPSVGFWGCSLLKSGSSGGLCYFLRSVGFHTFGRWGLINLFSAFYLGCTFIGSGREIGDALRCQWEKWVLSCGKRSPCLCFALV